ncbi:MAG: carboxylating nicotinate-nucleotide diphosphorylase [Candidatus Thorarchaeota archaeon]|nr:MAG: carboxylating nicotinate-nucleotide diphosphorylase [Candidatus Thorarchaeota archaeon]
MREPPPHIIESLKRFLDEDVRSGDLTTKAMGELAAPAVATIFSRSNTILAGIEEVVALAEIAGVKHEVLAFEGNWIEPGTAVMRLNGTARSLLAIERVCLNIIQRMSGIASKTYNLVQIAKKVNASVIVAATRKTTPGFRYFEKRAVQIGGGDPHRYALDDMVLIKNNHIALVGTVGQAVRMAKESVSYTKKVSCEVRSLAEALEAVSAGADIILLDNLGPKDIEEIHAALVDSGTRDRVLLEASGGIDEQTIKEYASSGVDVISCGALTHSYDSSNFNMSISLR